MLFLLITLDLCTNASTQGSADGIGGTSFSDDVTNRKQSIYRRRKRIIELKKQTIVRLAAQYRETPSPTPSPSSPREISTTAPNTSTKNPSSNSSKAPKEQTNAPKEQTNAPKNQANPVVPSVTKAPSPTYGSRYTPNRNRSSGVRSSLTMIIATISIVCAVQLITDI